eukprot:7519469-Alexandrium_andersonii.AAC.1
MTIAIAIREPRIPGAPTVPFLRQIWHLRETTTQIAPSGASGLHAEAVSGLAKFKCRVLQAILHDARGSQSSGELQGAPGSSGELQGVFVGRLP